MSDAVIAVGRDCVCGCPLVLRAGVERCSVYGEHRDEREACPSELVDHVGNVVGMRNRRAPGARLVTLCMEAS
ncbi:MAG: hypothetical protein KA129_10085 [Microthrixaceae bacterium]|jgi:hypothetical protein|nr:hypothetical protein [Microthrixaceae bacterium]